MSDLVIETKLNYNLYSFDGNYLGQEQRTFDIIVDISDERYQPAAAEIIDYISDRVSEIANERNMICVSEDVVFSFNEMKHMKKFHKLAFPMIKES